MSLPMRWEEIAPSPAPIHDPTPRRHRRSAPASRYLFAVVLFVSLLSILGLAGVGAMALLHNLSATPDLQRVADSSPGSQVTLGLVSIQRNFGFVTVTGNVASQAGHPLKDVEAVVELLDSHNQTLTMESAMISFRLLTPKQTSPFRVEVPDNTHAVAYRIHFKKLDGAELD